MRLQLLLAPPWQLQLQSLHREAPPLPVTMIILHTTPPHSDARGKRGSKRGNSAELKRCVHIESTRGGTRGHEGCGVLL